MSLERLEWGNGVFQWLRKRFEQVAPPLAGVLLVAGLALLLIAAGFATHSWMWARGQVRATATITENVSGFAKEGGVVYTPRFRFRLPSGELVTVQARVDRRIVGDD